MNSTARMIIVSILSLTSGITAVPLILSVGQKDQVGVLLFTTVLLLQLIWIPYLIKDKKMKQGEHKRE